MSELANFHFLRPLWLLLLPVLPWLLWQLKRWQPGSNQWQRVCDAHLLPHLLIVQEGSQPKVPRSLFVTAWVLAVVALAGPVWKKLPTPVYRAQFARMIVLDLSKSMDAQDVKPSRLARARFKILDLLKANREGQFGLLVFAATPFVVTPLTDDGATIQNMVPTLATDLMPQQGSQVHLALRKAGELLKQAGATVGDIVLLTDGMGDTAASLEAANLLKQSGYRLSVMAIGEPKGAPIPLAEGGFVKDSNGAIVIASVDLESLRQLAQTGGGVFTPMTVDDQDIERLSATPAGTLLGDTVENPLLQHTDSWQEAGPWLLLPLLPLTLLVFRRGFLVVVAALVLLPAPKSYAVDWASLWSRPDQIAAQEFKDGNAADAATHFTNPEWQGAAHFRAGDYAAASAALAASKSADGLYNLGNALAKQGKLAEAIQAYDKSLALAPDSGDARHNRELVKTLLEQQQQEKQNQDPSQSGQNKQQEQRSGNDTGDPQSARDGGARQPGSSSKNGDEQPSGDQADQASGDQTADRGDQQQQEPAAGTGNSPQGSAEQKSNNASPDGRTAQANDAKPSQKAAQPDPTQQQDKPRQAADQQMAGPGPDDAARQEQQQAMEQWLRRVPDDPGGLLRRKFARDYRRGANTTNDTPNPW